MFCSIYLPIYNKTLGIIPIYKFIIKIQERPEARVQFLIDYNIIVYICSNKSSFNY